MSQKTPTESIIEGLKQKALSYVNLPEETLTRRDLGSVNLEEILEDVKAVKQFAKRIADSSWKGIPLAILQACYNKLDQLRQPIEGITRFNVLNSGNVASERQTLIANFQSQWREIYTYIVPHLCFAESQDSSVDMYKDLITNFSKQSEAAKEKVEKDRERMNVLVKEIEQMAQGSVVTKEAAHFKTLANQYRAGAIIWIGCSIASGLILYFYIKDLKLVPATTTAGLIEALVPHLITVTLLSTAVIFCMRNFSSLMHNVIVNRHRQTSLSTFTTFVNSTDDPATRNAVLVQSTQAIFSPQPSGYLKTDTEMPQMNQVTEIVRGITSKEK